jgi:hypothetical protein
LQVIRFVELDDGASPGKCEDLRWLGVRALEFEDEHVVFDAHSDGSETRAPAEERAPCLEVELPAVPRTGEDAPVPAVYIVARSRRERRPADAPQTDGRALVGAVVPVGDEAVAEVENAHIRSLDPDETSPAGRKLVDPADGN